MPSIDVCIITRQRRGHLVRLLDALQDALEPIDRCYVLENGCPDRSTLGLQERFPSCAFLRSDRNLGVSGGRNRVACEGAGEVLLFLDDDASPGPRLLRGVRERFAQDGALTLLALRIDDPATGRPRTHEFPGREKASYERPFEPTYFVGAGFAVRRSAFEQVGGFDEHLSYSLEELDLSFRLLRRGARFAYDPALRVEHHAAPSGRSSGQFFHNAVRNRWWVPVRHLPIRNATSHIVLWTAVLLARAVRARQVRAWWSGLREGLRHLPRAVRARDPLPPDVLLRLRRQGARLWW